MIRERLSPIYSVALQAAIVVSAGCDSDVTQLDIEEQQQNVTDEQEKLGSLKERPQVEDQMDAQQNALIKEIQGLVTKANDAKGDREVVLRGEIAKLETKCEQAQDQLRELKAASGDQWAKLKIKADESWKDVSDSVRQKTKRWLDDASDISKPNDVSGK